MTFEELVAQAKELPLSQRKALIHDLVESIIPPDKPIITQRIFGLTKGTFIMSSDFDDELPDSFWLGNN